jgi:predicted RNA-binding Zn-ribbon protein involved in translation (DUF1610 family)
MKLKEPELVGSETEELDLTKLDEKVKSDSSAAESKQNIDSSTTPGNQGNAKPESKEADNGSEKTPIAKADNIINLNEILESEEKVELDNTIKREALADEDVFSKICPMCGEDMQINKQLLENTPVVVKCLKCGNETKVW